MTEPNHALLLYLLASITAFAIKLVETFYVGTAHEREDDGPRAARRFALLRAWLPGGLLALLALHLALLGASPAVAMWPLRLVVWMLVLQEDPAEAPPHVS